LIIKIGADADYELFWLAGMAEQTFQLCKGDIGMVSRPAQITAQWVLTEVMPILAIDILRLQPGLIAGLDSADNSLLSVQRKAGLGIDLATAGFYQQSLVIEFEDGGAHNLFGLEETE